jgi:AraC-like DNA-binding protein
MKPTFEQITTGIENSFSVVELYLNRFEGPYHFHPEIELTWIRNSSGKRFVGVNISDYEPGDLVLLGANSPHCWQSMNESSPDNAQAVVIQFRSNFAGDTFLKLPELKKIQELILKSEAGIIIQGETKSGIISKIKKCLTADKLYRILILIEILDLVANSEEIKLIDQSLTWHNTLSTDARRFQKVYSYLIENYQQDISLKTVSGIANMTPNAFCRYFKNVTRKTLVESVRELRINHACQLLRNTVKPINDICFESGFGNISYFNKTFKDATGYTPLHYRNFLS